MIRRFMGRCRWKWGGALSEAWEAFLASVDPDAVSREWTATTLDEARAEGFQRKAHKEMLANRAIRLEHDRARAERSGGHRRLRELAEDAQVFETDRQREMRLASYRRVEREFIANRTKEIMERKSA